MACVTFDELVPKWDADPPTFDSLTVVQRVPRKRKGGKRRKPGVRYKPPPRTERVCE